jgi:hypothetical protein
MKITNLVKAQKCDPEVTNMILQRTREGGAACYGSRFMQASFAEKNEQPVTSGAVINTAMSQFDEYLW